MIENEVNYETFIPVTLLNIKVFWNVFKI